MNNMICIETWWKIYFKWKKVDHNKKPNVFLMTVFSMSIKTWDFDLLELENHQQIGSIFNLDKMKSEEKIYEDTSDLKMRAGVHKSKNFKKPRSINFQLLRGVSLILKIRPSKYTHTLTYIRHTPAKSSKEKIFNFDWPTTI